MSSISQKKLVYTSNQQKKKLLRLIVQHPELSSGKYSKDFSFRDSQNLWCSIAVQCNAIPGAKKTWRQWRKTWQDMKSKTKRRMKFSYSLGTLSRDERETLGFKNVSSTTSYHDSENELNELENVQEETLQKDNELDDFNDVEFNEPESLSEPQSPVESKVFANPLKSKPAKIVRRKQESHSDNCAFNCDMLALQEQKKTQIKEDYYEFKKDYLRQKLLLMKEQTEALKDIAKELSK